MAMFIMIRRVWQIIAVSWHFAIYVLYMFCVNLFLEEQGGMCDSYDRPDGDVRLCQPAPVLSRRRLVIYQPPRHSPLPVVYIFA